MQCRRVASEVFTISQHSPKVRAAGTSMATCLPCFMPATAMGTCQIQGVAITTRSISSRLSRPSNAWSSPEYRPIGCEALPALSNLACVRSTLSLIVSHSAVMRTPGTAEKLSTSELPRPPVPMTPMRMVSWGLNGMSATLLPPEVWEREREAPSDASPASFNKSRREELSIALLLTLVGQPILAAAGFQPALAVCRDSRSARKSRLKGGCRQNCLPHIDAHYFQSCLLYTSPSPRD